MSKNISTRNCNKCIIQKYQQIYQLEIANNVSTRNLNIYKGGLSEGGCPLSSSPVGEKNFFIKWKTTSPILFGPTCTRGQAVKGRADS